MELTKEEILQLPGGDKIKRVNAFVGDGITDISDPKQRSLVVEEMKKSMERIMSGDVEFVESFDE